MSFLSVVLAYDFAPCTSWWVGGAWGEEMYG